MAAAPAACRCCASSPAAPSALALRRQWHLGAAPLHRLEAPALHPCHRLAPQQRRQPQGRSRQANALRPPPALSDAVSALLEASAAPNPGLVPGATMTTAVFILGYKVLRKGLTAEGVAHAWALGTAVFSAFGVPGFLLVCLYFIFGTLVTKLKMEQKQKEGIAEARSGQRGPASVWGSGIAGAACAALALATGQYDFWQIGFVASFCSKLSDTVSSEVGKAYGRTTYLVTTLERVPRGTEGAVSLEGTLAGMAAALAFSAVALAAGQVDVPGAALVTAAAIVANLAESYLGAAVQGRVGWLTNDVVNMLQISLAAGLAVAGKAYLGV